MQSARTAQLIARLKAHLEKASISQVTLSKELGISAANLSEIMRGNNNPNAEVTLHITEFLEQTMTTEIPKTLASARERIVELEALLAGRPGSSAEPAQPKESITQPTPTSADVAKRAAEFLKEPTAEKTGFLGGQAINPKPAAPMSAWEKEEARLYAIRTANFSSLPLSQQTPAQLRSALNAEKDPAARGQIYSILQKRKSEPKLTSDQAPAFDPERDLHNFKKLEVATPPPAKLLPQSAYTPFLIGEILKVTNFADLQSMLGNPAHSGLQRLLIYTEIKTRRAIADAHI